MFLSRWIPRSTRPSPPLTHSKFITSPLTHASVHAHVVYRARNTPSALWHTGRPRARGKESRNENKESTTKDLIISYYFRGSRNIFFINLFMKALFANLAIRYGNWPGTDTAPGMPVGYTQTSEGMLSPILFPPMFHFFPYLVSSF